MLHQRPVSARLWVLLERGEEAVLTGPVINAQSVPEHEVFIQHIGWHGVPAAVHGQLLGVAGPLMGLGRRTSWLVWMFSIFQRWPLVEKSNVTSTSRC